MAELEDLPVTAEDLATFDNDFADSKPPGFEYDPIPDGTYQARVHRVSLERAGGFLMLKWQLEITTGTYEGSILKKASFIRDGQLGYLKADLGRCGVTLELLHDLPDHLKDLLDLVVEIQQKTSTTKKDKNDNYYVNTYINKLVTKATNLDTSGNKPPPLDDGDIPPF